MAGKVKTMIDSIMEKRTSGQQVLVNVIRTKLILKGIHPDKFNIDSEDDPAIIAKLEAFAQELK